MEYKVGDVVEIEEYGKTKNIVIVSIKDNEIYYYKEGGELSPYPKIQFSVNPNVIKVKNNLGFKEMEYQGFKWTETEIEEIDREMANLDDRFSLFLKLAPKDYIEVYKEWEDQNNHWQNADMVAVFAVYVSSGKNPENFKYKPAINSDYWVKKYPGSVKEWTMAKVEYKFKKELPDYLMLDVVAETVIEKILSKAVKEFNMPQELSDKIWDGATEIIETLEKRMVDMFHRDEKFNKKLSSNADRVALDWAYMWMAHWAAHEIGVKFPEAKSPYLQDMTNKGLFFNNINQLLASIEEKMIIAMLKKGKTEKEVIEAFDETSKSRLKDLNKKSDEEITMDEATEETRLFKMKRKAELDKVMSNLKEILRKEFYPEHFGHIDIFSAYHDLEDRINENF